MSFSLNFVLPEDHKMHIDAVRGVNFAKLKSLLLD